MGGVKQYTCLNQHPNIRGEEMKWMRLKNRKSCLNMIAVIFAISEVAKRD